MALLNACTLQSPEALINKPAANRTAARLRMHCQMMDVATSPIMAAKDRTDHFTPVCCDKTHPGIPVRYLDARPGIRLAQTDALALLP